MGSTKHLLQNLAIDIYQICLKYNINLESQWLPREENKKADELSKSYDTDDWSIDNETFYYIESRYGRLTFDRFSDDLNKKAVLFNSKFLCPGTAGVNAFAQNWKGEFNWLCPPVKLIGKTLRHASVCKAKAVLFVPEWRSAYFWPLLTRNGKIFKSFVKHFLYLDPFYINNCNTNSVFDGFASFKAYALLIDFS